jgi:hypothetical protein
LQPHLLQDILRKLVISHHASDQVLEPGGMVLDQECKRPLVVGAAELEQAIVLQARLTRVERA